MQKPSNESTLREEGGEDIRQKLSEPRLHVLASPDATLVGREFSLTHATPFLLGRAIERDGVSVADPKMSRLHARIVWDGRSAMSRLGDAGSANGSFVDGLQQPFAALRHGSVIRLGDTVFVFAENDAMGTLRERARVAAASDASVLLLGESGTGKELLARQIHHDSARGGDFLALNCGSIVENLIGSELFGHVRGAFSGAGTERPGMFRAAHRGTLLLDEIGDLPLALQPALLRVLQERAVRPVGAEREVPVDVRVIAATHRDLQDAVERGRFRADLHARLAQVELALPPLRERRHEIASLIRVISGRWGLPVKVSADAMEALALWRWPQNVRELENLLQRLRVFSSSQPELDKAFLEREAPHIVQGFRRSEPPPKSLDAAALRVRRPSRDELARAMDRHGGNVAVVAEQFGTSRTQIYRWLKRFGLATPGAKR